MRQTISIVALLAGLATAGSGQPVTQLRPGVPTEVPGATFSRIADVRALSDDRIIVTDAIDRQAWVLDFTRQTSRAIGRQGAGPGEYRTPGRLLAISADSTLLVDNFGGRWLVMARDSFIGVVPSTAPAMVAGRTPLGADMRGNLLGMKPARSLEGVTGNVRTTNDSSWLVRVQRATGRIDTVAKYRVRPSRISIEGPSDKPTSVAVLMNPISAGEQGVMFADGAIAIARLDPYRVDWVIGDRTIKGQPLPFDAVPVTRDEKIAILKNLPRSDASTPRVPEDVFDWPAVFPPFPAGAVLPGPDGNAWIRRMSSLRAPATDYDIVDRSGRLVKRLHLPANEAIVAFGRATMFVIRTDTDDLQHVRRYPLPR